MAEAKRVHFVGVGGVGMGSLAVALAEAGFTVTGSDGKLYEPMKGVLARANVQVFEGYEDRTGQISADVVVVGNVTRKDNVEAQAWMRSGASFLSFPEAVRRFLVADRKSVVVAGTHGKTTTTTWIAYLLESLGVEPSYLIGGVPRDLPTGCRARGKDWFVGEGDEYDSAFFDKGPKFLHYAPTHLIVNSIEFDHADIYRDLDHVRASFEKLVALLPGNGLLLGRYEEETVRQASALAHCTAESFGFDERAHWRATLLGETEEGFRFRVDRGGKPYGEFLTKMLGMHNIANLTAGVALAAGLARQGHIDAEGLPKRIADIMRSFRGVRRRQEILLDAPIRLVDDFAHHPTEVAATLGGVRQRYPKGRLWAFFEPRSATARRNVHQDEYERAFDAADCIAVSSPFKGTQPAPAAAAGDKPFDAEQLAQALSKRGKSAKAHYSADEILERFLHEYKAGDVVVVMSNGEFGKIQEKLVSALTS